MGDICITKLDETDHVHFVVRRFRLTRRDETREIFHLHYTEWPDYGVPQSTKGILDLFNHVNICQEVDKFGGPIIVHCSAGVGRSATFIAIHYLLNHLPEFSDEPFRMISRIVLKMRNDRIGMVQTDKQYGFIYQVVNDYLRSAAAPDSDEPPLRIRTPALNWRNLSSDSLSVQSSTL